VITVRVGDAVALFNGSEWSGPPILIAHLNALTPAARENVPTSEPFPDRGLALEVLRLYGDGSIETAIEDPIDLPAGVERPAVPDVF